MTDITLEELLILLKRPSFIQMQQLVHNRYNELCKYDNDLTLSKTKYKEFLKSYGWSIEEYDIKLREQFAITAKLLDEIIIGSVTIKPNNKYDIQNYIFFPLLDSIVNKNS